MKKHVVFAQRVAGYLMLNGQKLITVDISKRNPNKNVFIFNDTEELRKLISKYDNFIDSIRDH